MDRRAAGRLSLRRRVHLAGSRSALSRRGGDRSLRRGGPQRLRAPLRADAADGDSCRNRCTVGHRHAARDAEGGEDETAPGKAGMTDAIQLPAWMGDADPSQIGFPLPVERDAYRKETAIPYK